MQEGSSALWFLWGGGGRGCRAPGSPEGYRGYHQAAYDFHVWLEDWREQARAVIQRRDYLIRLGLAARRSAVVDSAEEIEDVDPEADDDNEAPTR